MEVQTADGKIYQVNDEAAIYSAMAIFRHLFGIDMPEEIRHRLVDFKKDGVTEDVLVNSFWICRRQWGAYGEWSLARWVAVVRNRWAWTMLRGRELAIQRLQEMM